MLVRHKVKDFAWGKSGPGGRVIHVGKGGEGVGEGTAWLAKGYGGALEITPAA